MLKKLIVILFLAFKNYSAFAQNPIADDLFIDLIIASRQFDDGNYKKALKSYNSIIERGEKAHLEVDITEAYLYRAKTIIMLKLDKDICPDLKKALNFGSIAALELAKEKCPTLSAPKLKEKSNDEIGSKYFWDKDYRKAIPYFSKAIAQKPYDVLTLGYRAFCYQDIGQLDSALLDYNKILELDRDNPDRYSDRGLVLYEMGRFEESLADLNKAVEADPQNEIYLMAQGKTLRALKKYEESISCFNKVIEKLPWGECYLERAKCYLGLGDKVNACKDLMRIDEADKTEEIKELLKTCGQ